jgi:hypothetical protein
MDTTTRKVLAEYASHTQTLSNGGKLIHLYGEVFDYFHCKVGWCIPTRFKISKVRDSMTRLLKITYTPIRGYELSPEMITFIENERTIGH